MVCVKDEQYTKSKLMTDRTGEWNEDEDRWPAVNKGEEDKIGTISLYYVSSILIL